MDDCNLCLVSPPKEGSRVIIFLIGSFNFVLELFEFDSVGF